jgi:hypothetical protein
MGHFWKHHEVNLLLSGFNSLHPLVGFNQNVHNNCKQEPKKMHQTIWKSLTNSTRHADLTTYSTPAQNHDHYSKELQEKNFMTCLLNGGYLWGLDYGPLLYKICFLILRKRHFKVQSFSKSDTNSISGILSMPTSFQACCSSL